jgi:hypothetical protein
MGSSVSERHWANAVSISSCVKSSLATSRALKSSTLLIGVLSPKETTAAYASNLPAFPRRHWQIGKPSPRLTNYKMRCGTFRTMFSCAHRLPQHSFLAVRGAAIKRHKLIFDLTFAPVADFPSTVAAPARAFFGYDRNHGKNNFGTKLPFAPRKPKLFFPRSKGVAASGRHRVFTVARPI